MMSKRQNIVGLDIDLFTHIYVERIYNIVKDFKTHMCVLDFDILFLKLLANEKNNEIKKLIYNL